MKNEQAMEENIVGAISWGKDGLCPAMVQDAATGEALMLAWMNQEALRETLATGYAAFWSRSRQCLWRKGETSGNRQKVLEIRLDCDADALLLLVAPEGPACHTGSRSCFFRRIRGEKWEEDEAPPPFSGFLAYLFRVIEARRGADPASSYTASLLAKGRARAAQKVGEEAVECVIAAMEANPAALVAESADLWFHSLVLLASSGVALGSVAEELLRRHLEKSVSRK